MAELRSVSTASTFVLRFQREWSEGRARWRGRIEHIQSGESATSLDLEGILDFIRRHGIMSEPPGQADSSHDKDDLAGPSGERSG